MTGPASSRSMRDLPVVVVMSDSGREMPATIAPCPVCDPPRCDPSCRQCDAARLLAEGGRCVRVRIPGVGLVTFGCAAGDYAIARGRHACGCAHPEEAVETLAFILANLPALGQRTVQHVSTVAVAVALAVLTAVP